MAIQDGLDKLWKYYCKFDKEPVYILALSKSIDQVWVIWCSVLFYSTAPILQALLNRNGMGRCRQAGCGDKGRQSQCQKLKGGGIVEFQDYSTFQTLSIVFSHFQHTYILRPSVTGSTLKSQNHCGHSPHLQRQGQLPGLMMMSPLLWISTIIAKPCSPSRLLLEVMGG
jgi:hypothetical protein